MKDQVARLQQTPELSRKGQPHIREFRVTINLHKPLGPQILLWQGRVEWKILERLTGRSRQYLHKLAKEARLDHALATSAALTAPAARR